MLRSNTFLFENICMSILSNTGPTASRPVFLFQLVFEMPILKLLLEQLVLVLFSGVVPLHVLLAMLVDVMNELLLPHFALLYTILKAFNDLI